MYVCHSDQYVVSVLNNWNSFCGFRGKNILNQKSELQKALEKHKDSQAKKEIEQQRLEDKTPLEKVIEERARRLEIVNIFP